MKTKNNTGDLYVAFSLWSLILLMLAGCGSITVGAEPLPAKAADPSEVEPQEVDRGGIGTIEAGLEPTPMPERTSYSNETYGFGFDYPETWALTEEDHGVILKKDSARLEINFRRMDESDINPYFGRTGMGAGDFIYAGKIDFLNQVVPVEALVYDEKTKAVFYGENGLVETGDRFFLIVLEDLETEYTEVDLPDDLTTEANLILESFQELGVAASAEPAGDAVTLEEEPSIHRSLEGAAEMISAILGCLSPRQDYLKFLARAIRSRLGRLPSRSDLRLAIWPLSAIRCCRQ